MEANFKVNGQIFSSIDALNAEGETPSTKAKEVEVISNEEIIGLMPVLEDLKNLTLKEKILLANGLAEELSGEFIFPLVSRFKEEWVYQHCWYASACLSFSPVLSLPHSGQGFSTVKEWVIKHPAIMAFEVTVSHLHLTPEEEEKAEGSRDKEGMKLAIKRQKAIKRIKLEWKPDEKGATWSPYRVGEVLPEGAYTYRYNPTGGAWCWGSTLRKDGFTFVVGAQPTIKEADVSLVGDGGTATQARVTVKVSGMWVASSDAEKFASTLTKLCADSIEQPESILDTMMGSIGLWEAPPVDVSLENYCQSIIKGDVEILPLPMLGIGQETGKGAPTYNGAASFILALTGKRVLRKEIECEQMIEGPGTQEVINFPLMWDSDQFVEFRREWSKASMSPGVWGRWVDDLMAPILMKACGWKAGDPNFCFVKAGPEAGDEGWWFFHQADIRTFILPGTMETSTMKENIGASGSGGMYSEGVRGLGNMTL